MRALFEIYLLILAITFVKAQDDEGCLAKQMLSGSDEVELEKQNFDIIEEDKTAGMTLYAINTCESTQSGQILNMEFVHRNPETGSLLILDIVGPPTDILPPSKKCETFSLESDDYIKTIEVYSSRNFIQAVFPMTKNGHWRNWGQKTAYKHDTYRFDNGENELIGIYGAGDVKYMKALGFITNGNLECRDTGETDNKESETTSATETEKAIVAEDSKTPEQNDTASGEQGKEPED